MAFAKPDVLCGIVPILLDVDVGACVIGFAQSALRMADAAQSCWDDLDACPVRTSDWPQVEWHLKFSR